MKLKTKQIARMIAILIIVVLLIAMLFFCAMEISKIFKLLGDEEHQGQLHEVLKQSGIKGALAVATLQIIFVVAIFLPSVPLQMVAGYGYGVVAGSIICMIGISIGSLLLFLIVKVIGVWVNKFFMKNKSYAKVIEVVNSDGIKLWLITLLLYILPVLPYGIICIAMGSTKIRSWQFFLVCTFGCISDVLINTSMGSNIAGSNWIYVAIIGVVIVTITIVSIVKKDKIMAKFVKMSTKKKQVEDQVDKID